MIKKIISTFSEEDKSHMEYALRLAEEAKGKTFPNPAVGAVVVKKGNIVGKGATDVFGKDHAEKKALKEAKEHARGATLYLTLEPCNHYGRTPPCTHDIIDAGVKRVVIALKDPNPLVNGKGIRFLRRNKVDISVGLLRKEASELNEDFFWAITRGMPWITVKMALTFDGKIADIYGDSKWITNKKARIFVHDIRRRHAAIAIGSGTLKRDNPQLTVRHVRGKSPVRVVFASKTNLSKSYNFRKNAKKGRSIIVCNSGKKEHKVIRPDGIEIWYTGTSKTPQNLYTFMEMAYKEGLTSILIEGGQRLATSFLEHKLVNRLYLFYGNKVLGKGVDAFSFSKNLKINKSMHLINVKTYCFDDNIMVTGIPSWE